MVRTVFAWLSAAVILLAWHTLSWMILPMHGDSLHTLPGDWISTDLTSGVYHYPGLPISDEQKIDWHENMQKGPHISMMVYNDGPVEIFTTKTIVVHLLSQLASALLLLVFFNRHPPTGWNDAAKSCLMLGGLIIFFVDIPTMNWFKMPWSYTYPYLIDRVIPLLLVGLFFNYFLFKKM